MSRVLGVADDGRSIRVHITDVRPNDILFCLGDESDAIIEKVEQDGNLIRFVYKDRGSEVSFVKKSNWMNLEDDSRKEVFLHDLMRERFEFVGEGGT